MEINMELNNILKLIDAVSESSLSSFSLEDGQVKLNLSNVKPAEAKQTDSPYVSAGDNLVNDGQSGVNGNIAVTDTINDKSENPNSINGMNPDKNTSDIYIKQPQVSSEKEQPAAGNTKQIVSPLVGTFYNSASPDDEPMVNVGDTVKKGQVIGIIEAMKLMNEIESEYDGVVKEILVNNEDVVEYGQPLFVIA